MLIRAQKCYKWLLLFNVPADCQLSGLTAHVILQHNYIENFVHDNECYGNNMQQKLYIKEFK